MIMHIRPFALLALLAATAHAAVSPSDIPSDTPVANLLSTAKSLLGSGAHQDALTYYDVAISRDPSNYIAVFQRGATYLSLGRNAQAMRDFENVLELKPGFEAALLQLAKIQAKNGDWSGARKYYEAAGRKGGQEIESLEEAQGAAVLAEAAENSGDWEGCIANAGVAIMVASTSAPLRSRRARCRFERGEIQEGTSDLQHVLQIAPGSIEPHLQISSMLFYALGDLEQGQNQIRRCLHSDPDSKVCSRLYRREKVTAKAVNEVKQLVEKRGFNSAAKILAGHGEDTGLLQDLKEDLAEFREAGYIHAKAPNSLYNELVEITCEAYSEMKAKTKATPYCTETLQLNPNSLAGLLFKAQNQIDAEDYEPAMHTLNAAKEHHPQSQKLASMLQNAQVLLKRSKQKDYYKVLGVSKDADDRTIKRAYRNLIKIHHPDKVVSQGVSKEDAEKKMAQINEAYEVLSDPELKARFDRGDDPNSQEGQQGNPFQGSPFGGGGQQQFFFKNGPGGGGQQHFKFSQQGGGGGFQFPGGFPFG